MAEAKALIKQYFTILRTNETLEPNEAAIVATQFAKAHFEQQKAEGPSFLLKLSQLKEVCQHAGAWAEMVKLIGATFGDSEILNAPNFPKAPVPDDEPPLGLDLLRVDQMYEAIVSLDREDLSNSLAGACERLLHNLVHQAASLVDSSTVRQFAVMLENPLLIDPGYSTDITQKLLKAITNLPEPLTEVLKTVFQTYSTVRMSRLVDILQQFITVRLYSQEKIDDYVVSATRVLGLLAQVNDESPVVSIKLYYNDAINEQLDLRYDYKQWQRNPDDFCFCNHSFILDPAAKSVVLQEDAQAQMRQAVVNSLMTNFDLNPYLVLRVHRENLVHNTLAQINFDQSLKKSLKVQFVGEEGIDEGGVKKEFFQLLCKELLDPQFGMFTYNESHLHTWFNPNSFESDSQFRLIGAILGMAIYNGVILDVKFPMVVYRKLLGCEVSLEDLHSYDPDLYLGFKKLLEFDGDVESTFCRMFVYEYEWLGEEIAVELKEGGKEIAVTEENREEFVELYVKHLLDTSIQQQFAGFSEGFQQVCGGAALQLFRPEELELLICGSGDLDFEALQRECHYDEGFDSENAVIGYFWEVVHAFSDDQKKKFLKFATGSDRVPIKGLGNLQFVITKAGPDSERLPSAHTCFNHLLLPEYSSKEKLKAKLEYAMENDRGFGMI